MTPSGVLAFYFLFFALVISLFAAGQMTAARHEEADQRLETLFALPVGRRLWLLGRMALALAGALGLELSRRARASRLRACSRQAPTVCPSCVCSWPCRDWALRPSRARPHSSRTASL